VAAAFPLASEAHGAIGRVRSAEPAQIAAAALLHAAMLVASALCWRRAFAAFGGRVSATESCVRYGVGTFLNAIAPARAGGAVRIGLFTRSLSGARAAQRSGAALLAIGSVRIACVAMLLAGAASAGLAPRWLLATPPVVVAAGLIVQGRLRAVRQSLDGRCLAVLCGWGALAAVCRCASIGAALAAVGVASPVASALIGLLGLELSGLVPLAPGLAGVGGAAVAVAIATHGVPTPTAVAGGVAFHVAEGTAGIAFGLVTTAAFLLKRARAKGDGPVAVWWPRRPAVTTATP
jgi:uncharacterized membrane protein YbhN (UPF0104 family)